MFIHLCARFHAAFCRKQPKTSYKQRYCMFSTQLLVIFTCTNDVRQSLVGFTNSIFLVAPFMLVINRPPSISVQYRFEANQSNDRRVICLVWLNIPVC